MNKVINIILLVVLGVSLSGCEWFEHENYNKKDEVEIESLATELLTYGAEGYIVLCDTFKAYKYEKKIDSRWVVADTVVSYQGTSEDNTHIEINVEGLKYGSNNYIEIIVDGVDNPISYCVGKGESLSDGEYFSEDFKYKGKKFVIEGVFKLDDSENIFIDFVHRDDNNNSVEIKDEKWAEQILTSSEIENIVNGEDKTKYKKTYISLSWMPNSLPRECYNIDGKMYTKSMMGDRWIYLANQYPPLGYMTSTTEIHMIACVTLKNKGNGFKDKYIVIPFKENGCINNAVVNRKNL